MYGVNCWPVIASPFGLSASQSFFKEYGISLEGVGAWEGGYMEWFYNEDRLSACAEKMLPILRTQGWQYYDQWKVAADQFEEIYKKFIDQPLASLSSVELSTTATNFYDAFVHQYTVSNIIEPLSAYFQNHLHALLQEQGCDPGLAEQLVHQYGISARPNYIKECVEDYGRIKIEADIPQLLKKYAYINNDFSGRKPFTKKDLEELVQKHTSSVSREVLTAPAAAESILEALQIVATIQDVRKKYSLMWVEGVGRMLEEQERRTTIPVRDLYHCLWKELIQDKINPSDLKRRQEGCVIHWDENGEHVYTDEEAKDIKADASDYLLKNNHSSQEVSGFVASPGSVRGRAVVILDPSHAPPMQAGDILVTAMTRPEFLPLMYKAAAFVTDEGGITSHAAIVAREMNKPCIIGTKIATKVFKTGDIIEIDGKQGRVRKA